MRINYSLLSNILKLFFLFYKGVEYDFYWIFGKFLKNVFILLLILLGRVGYVMCNVCV